MPPTPCALEAVREAGGQYVQGVALAEFDIDLGAVVRCGWMDGDCDGLADDAKYLAEQMLPDRSEGHEELTTVFFLREQKEVETSGTDLVVNTLRQRPGGEWTETQSNVVLKVVRPQKGQGSKGEIFVMSVDNETLQSIPLTAETVVECEGEMVVLKGTGAGFTIGIRPVNCTVEELKETVDMGRVRGEQKKPICEGKKRFLYCQNIVMKKKDKTVRRGAVIKAVSIMCTSPVFVWCFTEVMKVALRKCLDVTDDDEGFSTQKAIIEELYKAVNDEEVIGLKKAELGMSADRCKVWQQVIKDEQKIVYKTKVSYGGVEYPVSVPYHVGEEEFCLRYGRVAELYDTFKEAVPTIIDAIVSGCRVIFTTYNRSAEEVCSFVLAAASCLVTTLHTNFFPYTSLTCMDQWSSLPSFTVGATNPMFEHRKEWWDVLCNIDTGKVITSSDTSHQPEPSDSGFATKIMTISERYTAEDKEAYLRYHTRVYFQNICRLAVGDCHGIPDGELQSLWEGNTGRIKRWKEKGILSMLPSSFAETQPLAEAVHGLLRLRGSRQLTEEDSIVIYQSFVKTVRTEDDLLHFLLLMPKEAEGLFPIALGLFHPSHAVKLPCIAFLRRLDTIPEGKLVIHSLNTYLLLAYERNSRLMPGT